MEAESMEIHSYDEHDPKKGTEKQAFSNLIVISIEE